MIKIKLLLTPFLIAFFSVGFAQTIALKGKSNQRKGGNNTISMVTGGITASTYYVAGRENTIKLKLQLTNTDFEYGDSLAITLPTGFSIVSVTPNTSIGFDFDPTNTSGCPNPAISGLAEPFRGINGQTISWGDNDNCFGGIEDGSNGTFYLIEIKANVDISVSGPQVINYFISGDTWNNQGTTVAGDLTGFLTINECPSPVTNSVNVSFCSGSNVNINGNIFSTAGTFIDTLVSANGCDSIITYIITETNRPSLQITASNDTVCANGEVILNGLGATNLSWNKGVINGSFFYPTTSGFYTLTGYNTLGCESKDSILIVVKPNPANVNAYVNVTLPVCVGTTITHSAVADSYLSVNNNGNQSTLTTIVTSSFGSPLPNNIVTAAAQLANDGANITYNACEAIVNNLTGKIAVIERGSCTFVTKCLNAQNAGAIAVLVVNNQAGNLVMSGTDPNITIPCMSISQADGAAIITSLLNNNPVIISYGGAASKPEFTWLINGAEVANGTSYVFTPESSYELQVFANLNGCTSSTPNYFNPLNPVYHDTLYPAICSGDSVWAAGQFQTTSGTYYDSLTTIGGCDSITVTYLNVLPSTDVPTVNVSANVNEVCSGNAVTLTAVGADTYSWVHNGSITDIITEFPTQTTTYIVYGINSISRCRDTAMITILNKPNPENLVGFVNQAIPVCAGTVLLHTASASSVIQVNNNGVNSTISAVVSTSFGGAMPVNIQNNAAVLVDDGTPINYNACESIINNLAGKVAIIERGACSFDVKCLNAQNAGAVAIIVVNNNADAPFSMGVSGNVDASLITIPCMMISQANGASIITALQNALPVIISYGGATSSPSYTFKFTENSFTTVLTGNNINYTPFANYDLNIEANLNGCLAYVNYSNTIKPEYNDTLNVQSCIGSTYVFGGQNITLSGTYYDSTTAVLAGCDSVTVLNIVFTNQLTNTVNVEICNGTNYIFNGQTLGTNGQYTATYISAGGCDSVVTLNLNVLSPNQTPSVIINASENLVCEGSSVLLEANGATNYTWINDGSSVSSIQPNVFTTTTYSVVGFNDYIQCADTAVITINSKPLPSNLVAFVDVTLPVCAGTPVNHTGAAEGLITVNVNGGNDYQVKGVHTTNFGSPLPLTETSYEAVLVDDQTGVTYDGCEAITNDLTGKIAVIRRGNCSFVVKCYNAQLAGAVAVVMVNNSAAAPISMGGSDPNINIPCLMVSQMDGDVFINALQLAQSLNITIGGPSNTPVFTWDILEDNGTVATSNDNPFEYTPNSNYALSVTANLNGCTNVRNYYNTINPVIRDTIAFEACNGTTVVVGSLNITNSGEYVDTLQTISGCDSIIVANVSFVNKKVHNISASICDNETYTFDGSLLNISGVYRDTLTAAAGCDSIIVLNLTVNPTNAESVSKTICEGGFYPFGTQSPSTAGIYTETFTNKFGCDSVVTLNLNVTPLSYNTAEATICEGSTYTFGTQSITSAGVYNEVFSSLSGCDSTVTLTVTVNPLPVVSILAAMDTVCDNGGIIALDGSPNGYNGFEWYSGNGVVDSTFNPVGLSGTQTIYYGITDVNGCYNEDSTSIYVEICTGINFSEAIKVSAAPNPFNNQLKINVQGNAINSILITDVTGRELYNNTSKGSITINTDSFVRGIYFVNVTVNTETSTFRVVKQ